MGSILYTVKVSTFADLPTFLSVVELFVNEVQTKGGERLSAFFPFPSFRFNLHLASIAQHTKCSSKTIHFILCNYNAAIQMLNPK